MNWTKLCVALFLLCALSAVAVFGQNITSVVETGGDNEPTDTITAKWTGQTFERTVNNEPSAGAPGEPFTVGTFGHQAPTFVDRNHRYSDHFETSNPPEFRIPAYLVGGEYIMSGNDNRDNGSFRLDVTVANPSTVFMLIDNRLGAPNSPNADPPSFGPTKMQWILDEGWAATANGLNRLGDPAVPDEVPVDEGADNDIDQWYSVYRRDFPAGMFSLLQPDNAGQNMYGVVVLRAGPVRHTWIIDANGNWTGINNWAPMVPNAAGVEAAFAGVITAPRTVTVNNTITVGSLFFDSAQSYTIAGSNTLTLDSTSGDAQINVASGNHTISAPVTLADNTTVTVTPAASNLAITGTLTAAGQNLTKAGAGTLTLNNVRAAGLSVNAGTVAVAPNGSNAGTSAVSSLSIAGDAAPTAKLDLANNAAVVNYTGASPAATIRQQILTGRGGSGLGNTWNGLGITSSTAAAAAPESRSIGYAENSALPLGPYTNLRGQPVDATSVLMAFTRTGDANLDGIVNDDDVTIVGATYAPGVAQPSWALGDFDYNGFVDDDDVTLLGVFYDPAAPPLAAPAAAGAGVAAVPEPSTLGLLSIAAAALLWRRRFRRMMWR
ncbi:MAG: PEP-CTERM sorting domain-containing protein [Pirellulales bacterium]